MERLKKSRHARNLEKRAVKEKEKSSEQLKSVRKISFTPCTSIASTNLQESNSTEESEQIADFDRVQEIVEFEKQSPPFKPTG